MPQAIGTAAHCAPRRSRRRSFLARLSGFAALARSRRALARLDAEALRDIGLSRAEAQREARRAPWDVPSHWTDAR
ncbi:hypothetical protein FIU94_00510 [Sulfitobacter sp. THAF37]|uniref:DUF1127 domain-containing protein n=1 Tax=Sulfitobacter sp. THAF37 TaxID=2587855 RepID=UPI001267BD7E|nr:DUF1127 domain-containing protein [Sulfitobacter sp. THAF37]QFT57289.1 hypothetical protein FIU94_00510 [Sulfitobacter sp. THAF37]